MWRLVAGTAPAPRSPAWALSPLRKEGPGSPATPSTLYRSCFAEECEAIVLQLGARGEGRALPPPIPLRGALTVEAERLTPLEAPGSFLDETKPGPSEEAGRGAEESPPPSPPLASSGHGNLTYDAAPSLCEASGVWPSEGRAAAWQEDGADAHRTLELQQPGEAPVSFVASTPVPSTEGFSQPTAEARRLPRAGCFQAPLALWKGRAAVGTSLAGSRAAPAEAPGARSARRRGPQAAAGARLASGPETAGGAAANSQPLGRKLPAERKNNLSKLQCNQKPPVSTQPSSIPCRGPGARGSLIGLAHPGKTKLLVCAAPGGNKMAAKPSPRRPLGRQLVKVATSLPKQSTSKQSCAGKSFSEKPTCGVLLDAGQIPSAAPNRPTAPCSQCQHLAEENEQLRSLLEDFRINYTRKKETA